MAQPAPLSRWWIPLGGLLLSCLYLPTLGARFDFIDDGNLVYPTPADSVATRADIYWGKVVANYEHLGPFRPTLWLHWELQANLFGGGELAWRVSRWLWCALAASALLWLLAELGFSRGVALATAAAAFWNPYRNEIWTSLTLSEGVAMPYALAALACARAAHRSSRPWRWDVLGVVCVLVCLGCKNTFAALVPAQALLRMLPDGFTWRESLRRHGTRSALLGLTLLAPAAHAAYFAAHWHPGQYRPPGPSVAQFRRILTTLSGAAGLPYLGAGLLLAVVAAGPGLRAVIVRHRAALIAGGLLLVGGALVYLSMGAMAPRYSMPAVWGVDLALAALLAGLAAAPASRWRLGARLALAAGLLGCAVAHVGRQEKLMARSNLLWDAVEALERMRPAPRVVEWCCGDSSRGGLNVEEGIHVQWHLQARGRGDIRIRLVESDGSPVTRVETASPAGPPDAAVWGPAQADAAASWGHVEARERAYWFGRKRFGLSVGR